MFEKDGMFFESEEEYDSASLEIIENRKKKKKKILILASLLLFIALLFFSCYRALIPVEYRIFTEKRIDFLENKYMMELDDVKPERYWTVSIAQDHDANFNFSSVESYSDFMENNFRGEITSSVYVGQKLDNGNVIEEMGEKNLVAQYKCKAGKIGFIIRFYEDGESYRAKVVSYSAVGIT